MKSISEFLKGHEATVDEWERNESVIFPILAKYQQDGYKALLKRGDKYGGAFLCDGVGLGKTFVGLMLIERFLMYKGNRKSVALFVPKAAREAVWESELRKHLPKTLGGFSLLKYSIIRIYIGKSLPMNWIMSKLKPILSLSMRLIIFETGVVGVKLTLKKDRATSECLN